MFKYFNLLSSVLTISVFIIACLQHGEARKNYDGELQSQYQYQRLEGLPSDATPAAGPTLPELYAQLTSLFDPDAIADYIAYKNATDPAAATLLVNIDTYMRSENASNVVDAFWGELGLRNSIYYLYINGFTEIYERINEFHAKYGYAPVVGPNFYDQGSPAHAQAEAGAGDQLIVFEEIPKVVSLVQNFLNTLPLDGVRVWLEAAVKTEAGKALYDRLAQAEVREGYRTVRDADENMALRETLISSGFEVDTLRMIVEQVMTWENHTSVGLREMDGAIVPPRRHAQKKEFQLY